MSLPSKSLTAIGAVFILSVAGAIGVTAQTQTTTDNSSSSTAASAAVTTDPKKADAPKPSAAAPAAHRDTSSSSTSASAPVDSPALPGPQTPNTDKWQFQLTPYFWLASLHGTTGTGNFTTQVDESFSDNFHTLNFAFMGVLEARKGKLVSLTDMEYINVSDDKATPGPLYSGVNAKVKMFIFDPEVGYRVFDNPDTGASVDVVGGVRVWHISTDLIFSPRVLPGTEFQASRTWVDAVFGMRFKAALSKKAFVSGKFDLGGGGSKFTYQIFGGVGYSIKPNIALIGGYRVLDVNYGKNNFVYDMNQRGPILGVGFKF